MDEEPLLDLEEEPLLELEPELEREEDEVPTELLEGEETLPLLEPEELPRLGLLTAGELILDGELKFLPLSPLDPLTGLVTCWLGLATC
ncbi:MAG TPA: hypothetical protein DG754_04175 [Bacteroidales bacterium]|nr:hypothetical protein [Bacteroidales bacterium]